MIDALKSDFVLFGRSTSTVEATDLSDKKNYLLKFSWQESLRPREAVVIQKAREIGGKEDSDVLENLPQLIAHRELNDVSMAILNEQLGFAKSADEVKGSRTLCILAFDIFEPITSLQGMALWRAYWEIIKCHYILWKRGIQHGDISVSNLMHRNGTGALNDFDLARLATPHNPYHRGCYRTGTTPFLALDLLAPERQGSKVERRYRHDLESFFWVLAWITACYDDGVELKLIPANYRLWLDANIAVCYAAKSAELLRPGGILRSMRKSYKGLAPVIPTLNKYWTDFHNAQLEQKFHSDADLAWQVSGSPPPSPLAPIMATELSDEEMLDKLLHAFVSNSQATRFNAKGLLKDLPVSLFPTDANVSAVEIPPGGTLVGPQ